MSRQGNFYVIAAPSGAGKTSLVRALVDSIENLSISISYTTRPPRPNDVEGKDYYFINSPQFERKIVDNVFLEYAKIYGHFYGTSRQWVLDQLSKGNDVLLEIDWQGAQQIRSAFPPAILIFIIPPSLEVLEQRLRTRKQDNETVIAERLACAQHEISQYRIFDYLVVNEDFGQALTDLQHIIYAERLRCPIQAERFSIMLANLLKSWYNK